MVVKNEDIIKYDQLITKIEIGKFNFGASDRKIIILSKGLLIVHNKEIVFYDFKRYQRRTIIKLTKEKEDIELSKLLNDKFCLYSNDETLIYQFNNNNFSATLLKRINVNLKKLIEIEKDKYINITQYYYYIWTDLRPIFKSNQIFFYIIDILIAIFIRTLLIKYGKILTYVIIIFQIIIFIFILKKFIYLLNPYKRIKGKIKPHIKKCGKNICFISAFNYIGILDYKNLKIKRIIKDEKAFLYWNYFIVNEKIIIFNHILNNNWIIYDMQNDIKIREFKCDFNIMNTYKIDNNSYVTFDNNEMIKWKYNFRMNNIDILDRKNIKYLGQFLKEMIANNKLYIVKKKHVNNFQNKYFYLYIYK